MNENMDINGDEIILLVEEQKYNKALGVFYDATDDEINNAYIELSTKFKDFPDVIEALNFAKLNLNSSTPLPDVPIKQQVKLYYKKTINFITDFVSSIPARFLAMIATIIVLLEINSVLFTLFIIVIAFFYAVYFRRTKYKLLSRVLNFTLLFLFGSGLAMTFYFILGEFIIDMKTFRAISGIIIGLALIIYPGIFLEKVLIQKLYKPNLWKRLGFFCVLFIITFGLSHLVTTTEPILKFKDCIVNFSIKEEIHIITTDFAHNVSEPNGNIYYEKIKRKVDLLPIFLKFIFIYFLTVTFAFIYSGPNWKIKWNKASELRFSLTAMLTLLSALTILEIFYYFPFIGKYIGGVLGANRVVPETIPTHMGGFLLFYGMACFSAIPFYLVNIRVWEKLSKKNHISLDTKFIVFAISLIISSCLISVSIFALGLQTIKETGFSKFLEDFINILWKVIVFRWGTMNGI